jgi:hypothetical protein
LLIQLSGNRIYPKEYGQLGLGFKLGIGYMNGFGYFKNSNGTIDPTPSDLRMIFWTIPMDFAMSLEFPITTMFKVGGSAGPSALVMIQNRSEEDQDGRKNVRRYGYGYFLEGNLKIELLRWFSDEYTRKVFQQYSMTNTFITISVRKVHYNNFSSSQRKFPRNKDIKVEGESFGVGLAYEFL